MSDPTPDPAYISRMSNIMGRIQLPFGWRLYLGSIGDHLWLRVEDPKGKCNVTGAPMPWSGRKWLLSTHMTDGEVVQTAFMALLAAAEHEAREGFFYLGRSILDPHYDLRKLWELRGRPDALKEREDLRDQILG